MQSTDTKTDMTKDNAIPVRRSIKIELQEALPDGYLVGRLKKRRPKEERWTLEDAGGGYREQLYALIYPEHFDRLKAGRRGYFAGTDRRVERFMCAPAEQVYADICSCLSAAVTGAMPGGIALSDMETLMSVLPGKNREMETPGYETEGVLYFFLVSGYDQETGFANSVGGLSLEYRIKSADFEEGLRSLFTEITARFVAYSDVKAMERDLKWLARLNGGLFTPPDGTLEACLGVDFFHSRNIPARTYREALPEMYGSGCMGAADAVYGQNINPLYGYISYGDEVHAPADRYGVYLPAAGAGSVRHYCQLS